MGPLPDRTYAVIAYLIAFAGRALTALLAGLAANVVGCLVKGFDSPVRGYPVAAMPIERGCICWATGKALPRTSMAKSLPIR